jgi:hypothetical protein
VSAEGESREAAQLRVAAQVLKAAGLEGQVNIEIVRRIIAAWERLRATVENDGVVYCWYERRKI